MNFDNFDYDKLTLSLKRLKAQYPFLKIFSVGKSLMKRDLWCIRVGKGERKILSVATHHSLEWVTGAASVSFLRDFSCSIKENQFFSGVKGQRLYENATYYIIPMLNPDGCDIVINGIDESHPYYNMIKTIVGNGDVKLLWQANARGVDLNHNYDSGFCEGREYAHNMGITSPNFTRYSGERPFSEPETKSLKKLCEEIGFDVAVAFHTQGEVIYAGESTDEKYLKLSKRLSRCSGYELSVPRGIAACSGFKDWAMEKLNLPSFTIELGMGKNPLPFSQFEKITQPCYNILKELALF